MLATSWRLLVDNYGPAPMLRLRATLQGTAVADAAFAFSANDIFYEQVGWVG